MTIVSDDLDVIQARLHDNEALWTRAELLRYYNDGYKELISKSAAVMRFTILDVPGRFGKTITYDWEDRYASGTINLFTFPCKAASMSGTFLWETQQVMAVTPTNSQYNTTQLWEIVYSGVVDNHFRFALPKTHDHIRRIAYDDELLFPVSVRELDESDRIWFRASGQPQWWTPGVGRPGTFEVYEIRTDYQQGYQLTDFETGLPRLISGSNTYTTSPDDRTDINAYAYTTSGDSDALTRATVVLMPGLGCRITIAASDTSLSFCTQQWEADFVNGDTVTTGATLGCFNFESDHGATARTFALGLIRDITSPDRQYLALSTGASPDAFCGIVRDFKSSVNSVSIMENVIPENTLTESDVPDMIPTQLSKYLRYYVLSRAYGREGEGKRPDLSAHYMLRFKRGITVFSRMANITHLDRYYIREETMDAAIRPPRVRLPVHYPQVLY